MSLPVEHPREALVCDEALLDAAPPGGSHLAAEGALADGVDPGAPHVSSGRDRADGTAAHTWQPLLRWWVASAPAVVVGLGSRHHLSSIVDLERCRAAGIEVLERRAGGGAVLVDRHMLCGAVCLPTASIPADVTDSYRWLGDDLAQQLRAVGLPGARRVEIHEARADVAALRDRSDALARLLLACCYGALSPHEVVVGAQKLVGLAQVRRRHACLFQFGVLLGDQSGLADLLAIDDESVRADLRAELRRRTVGVDALLGPTPLRASAVAAAIAGARPCGR